MNCLHQQLEEATLQSKADGAHHSVVTIPLKVTGQHVHTTAELKKTDFFHVAVTSVKQGTSPVSNQTEADSPVNSTKAEQKVHFIKQNFAQEGANRQQPQGLAPASFLLVKEVPLTCWRSVWTKWVSPLNLSLLCHSLLGLWNQPKTNTTGPFSGQLRAYIPHLYSFPLLWNSRKAISCAALLE